MDTPSPPGLVEFFLSGNGGGVFSWSLLGMLLASILSIIDVLLNVFLRDGISGREVFGCVDFTDDRVSSKASLARDLDRTCAWSLATVSALSKTLS